MGQPDSHTSPKQKKILRPKNSVGLGPFPPGFSPGNRSRPEPGNANWLSSIEQFSMRSLVNELAKTKSVAEPAKQKRAPCGRP